VLIIDFISNIIQSERRFINILKHHRPPQTAEEEEQEQKVKE
jgi:hypothetical protein